MLRTGTRGGDTDGGTAQDGSATVERRRRQIRVVGEAVLDALLLPVELPLRRHAVDQRPLGGGP